MSKATILVIEDEMVIAMLIEDTLAASGYRVCGPFRTVEHALSAIEETPPDAALLDLNLGRDKNSYAVAEALRERDVPFIFLTGYDERALEDPFKQSPLLNKPFDPATLTEAIAKLLYVKQ